VHVIGRHIEIFAVLGEEIMVVRVAGESACIRMISINTVF
jgi:hypothetical protein